MSGLDSNIPSELQESPQARRSPSILMDVPAEIKIAEAPKAVACAPVPSGPSKKRSNDLLSDVAGIDADEEFSKDETLLNEFVKLHPMLSLQATSSKTLQLVSGMMEKAHVKVAELESVSKSHDDLFLRCERFYPHATIPSLS